MTTRKKPARKAATSKDAPKPNSKPEDLIIAPATAPDSPPTPKASVKEPICLNPEQVKIIDGMREKVSNMKAQVGELAVQRAQHEAQVDQLGGQIKQITGMIGQIDQEVRDTLFGYLCESGVDPQEEQWTFQFATNSFVRVRSV